MATSVRYHTTITLPWKQAKLIAYTACMNVLFHEKSDGRIPLSNLPPRVDTLVKGVADTPEGRRLMELDAMLRAVLFDEQAK